MANFAVDYVEVDNKLVCKITNNTGKKFNNVAASYVWRLKGGTKTSQDASAGDWAAGETREMPMPPRQPGVRWQGAAVGADGVASRVDIAMPMPPAEKKE